MTGGRGSRSGGTAAPTSRGNSALRGRGDHGPSPGPGHLFPRGSLTIDAGDQAPAASLGGSPGAAARAAEPRSQSQAAAPPHRSAPSSGRGPRAPDLGGPTPSNPAAAAPFPAKALPRMLGTVVHSGSCSALWEQPLSRRPQAIRAQVGLRQEQELQLPEIPAAWGPEGCALKGFWREWRTNEQGVQRSWRRG